MATQANPATQSPRSSAKLGVLFFVVAPPVALAIAIWMAWGQGVYALDIGQLIFWHFATGMGVTVGFHRLFTHTSFKTYGPIKFFLAVLGSMAVQGSLFKWCAVHWEHHAHSDQPDDPHSPHAYGDGFWASWKGFWYAHVIWLFKYELPAGKKIKPVEKMKNDPWLVWADKLFLLWIILGLLIPAAIGGLIVGTWEGAFRGFLWGGLIRVGAVHHVTWSINSVCHIWGRQDFETTDQSRNNWFFGVFGWGEGWHNGHHAFMDSAKHGLLKWQIDPSWWAIKTMSLIGLVWDCKLPSQKAIETKLRK